MPIAPGEMSHMTPSDGSRCEDHTATISKFHLYSCALAEAM